MANRNNTKRTDGSSFNDAYLKNGFVHVAAYQYQEQEYGGEIVYKGMLPMSSDSKTTITSSFGVSLSFSTEKNEGIKMDGAGKLEASIGVSNATSLAFTYQESTSTVTDDPMLSAQYAYNTSTKKTEAQWDFSVLNERIGGGKTYTITSYLLFEMSNRVSYFNRDVFNAYIHYSFTGQTPYWLIRERWSEGKTCTGANGGSYFK